MVAECRDEEEEGEPLIVSKGVRPELYSNRQSFAGTRKSIGYEPLQAPNLQGLRQCFQWLAQADSLKWWRLHEPAHCLKCVTKLH